MRRFWEYVHSAPYDPVRTRKVEGGPAPGTPEHDWTVLCPPEELKELGLWLEEGRSLVSEGSVYRQRIDLVDEALYKAYLVRASTEVLGEE